MPHPLRLAFVLVSTLPAALTAVRAQVIAVKSAPIADGGQFAFLPSANLGMGGLSIAVPDSTLDPFTNPAKGARLSGMRVFGAPTFFSVTRKAGGGLTLPLGTSWSTGAWFSQLVVAMQDVERPGNDNGGFVPVAELGVAGTTSSFRTTDVAVDNGKEPSRENRYVHGTLGRRFAGGLSIASSASWWRLNALDGMELNFPRSQRVLQHGEASDVRLGALKEFGPGHSIELVALHNRFAVNQDVAFNEPFWDPTQRQFTIRSRIDPNADRTDTWGLHLAYMRPLADSTWRVGAVLTGNRIRQPRLPAYDIPQIQADAGRAHAYNIGAGVARSRGPYTMGLDAIYEPISSRSWVRADEATQARDGTAIDAGTNVLDNRFRFNNAIARLGFSVAVPVSKEQAFTLETGGQLRAIQYRLEQWDAIQQSNSASTQRWNEWTRSWGVSYRFAGAGVHYRGNLTTGASRNGFDEQGNIFFSPLADARPVTGFAPFVPFGMTFGGVRTTTHQIAFSVPIR